MSKNRENLPDRFESEITKIWPIEQWENHRLLLAVSGGADSVALFRSFVRLAHFSQLRGRTISLSAAHIHHGLRASESDGDAEFVRRLAERFSVAYIEERIDSEELAREVRRQGSLEAAARWLRYAKLLAAAERLGARFLLTAHQADDRTETILQRVFRGSGVRGLVGIRPIRPLNEAVALVRPLLTFRRTEILDYLDRLGQTYRTDSSNASPNFTRNRIRNELIPLLESIFPNRTSSSLERLAEQCREITAMLAEQAGVLEKEQASLGLPRNVVVLDRFTSSPDPVIREFFHALWTRSGWPLGAMGARQWRRLVESVRTGERSIQEFPGGVAAEIHDGILTLSRKGDSTQKENNIGIQE